QPEHCKAQQQTELDNVFHDYSSHDIPDDSNLFLLFWQNYGGPQEGKDTPGGHESDARRPPGT
ncbi:MAG: hypothetical protein LPK88_06645, partial [Alphaproteobacteria bacterium]|nr:hypothetical protein [Alphaproteobacteria bacterium]MDX5415984.1 hypothetical protein [Alphaproteobacteria bacterium]MDX5493283.1 hypothetical protein [Alphaproteobacteria bacterium]